MSSLSRRLFQSLCGARHHVLAQQGVIQRPCLLQHAVRLQSSHVKPPGSHATNAKNSHPFSTSPAIQTEDPFEQKSEVSELISEQIEKAEVGRLFAVIHLNGKQRKVTTGDIVLFDQSVEADIGEKILLNKVLLVGGKDFSLVGRPLLSSQQVRVEGTVIEKTLSQARVLYWYRKRNRRSRTMYLHKNPYVYVRINSIQLAPTDSAPLDITQA